MGVTMNDPTPFPVPAVPPPLPYSGGGVSVAAGACDANDEVGRGMVGQSILLEVAVNGRVVFTGTGTAEDAGDATALNVDWGGVGSTGDLADQFICTYKAGSWYAIERTVTVIGGDFQGRLEVRSVEDTTGGGKRVVFGWPEPLDQTTTYTITVPAPMMGAAPHARARSPRPRPIPLPCVHEGPVVDPCPSPDPTTCELNSVRACHLDGASWSRCTRGPNPGAEPDIRACPTCPHRRTA
jgi:hypothetical protein